MLSGGVDRALWDRHGLDDALLNCGSTQWTTKASSTPDSGVFRDRICTNKTLKLIAFGHVDF